jgi:hypothetical protein
LRNAGLDLQPLVFEDAGRAPKAYPGIKCRNTNIDHRRVRNLAVYFQRHWRPIHRVEDLLPGDVILLDTFPSRPGPDHIGIVSDTLGRSRLPLIINAWTNDYRKLPYQQATEQLRCVDDPSSLGTGSARGLFANSQRRLSPRWSLPRMSESDRYIAGARQEERSGSPRSQSRRSARDRMEL